MIIFLAENGDFSSSNGMLLQKPIDGNDNNDAQNRSVDELIIFCQPVGKVDVKIIFG